MDSVEDKRPASFKEVQLLCLYQMAQESETLSAWLRASQEAAKKVFADSENMRKDEEIAALKLELAQAQGLKAVKPDDDAQREASV